MKAQNIKDLNDLIDKAEREGMWLYQRYVDGWFSPKELRTSIANGRFVWGAVNWELRNPQERIDELIVDEREAKEARIAFEQRLSQQT